MSCRRPIHKAVLLPSVRLPLAAPAFAQQQGQGAAPPQRPVISVEPTMPPQTGDPSYRGSVPQGQASATAIPLSLGEAIRRGLKANLGLLTSAEASRESRAQRLRALSACFRKLPDRSARPSNS